MKKMRNRNKSHRIFTTALLTAGIILSFAACGSKAEETEVNLTETASLTDAAEDVVLREEADSADAGETTANTGENETGSAETDGEETTETGESEEAAAAENESSADLIGEGAEAASSTEKGGENSQDAVEAESTAASSGYTYQSMSATMYAKKAVNVRSIPSKDGTKLGSLTAGQAVAVTGQCNETGWYRISYSGGTGYVSNNYLTTTKPTETTTKNSAESSTTKSSETTTKKTSNKTYSSITEKLWDLGYYGYDENGILTCYGDMRDYLTDAEFDQLCEEYAAEVVELVNKERTAAGLWELETNAKLTEAAQIRAEELATSFSHVRPDGTCGTVLCDVGLSAWYDRGENIAMGQSTAEEVMTAWMNSAGHKGNILTGAYDDYGTYTDSDGNTYETKTDMIGVGCYYANGTFYWVQLFAQEHTHSWEGYTWLDVYELDDDGNVIPNNDHYWNCCSDPHCAAYMDENGDLHEFLGSLDLSTCTTYEYNVINGKVIR